jgi:EpsI family protein
MAVGRVLAGPAWSPILFATVGLMLVSIAPVSAKLYWAPAAIERSNSSQPLEVSGSWRAAARDAYAWTPRFASPSSEFIQTYHSGNRVVKLYVAYFSAGQPGAKVVSAANVLFEAPWLPTAQRQATASLGGQTFRPRETVLESPSSSLLVWSWYSVDDTSTGNDYVGKLLLAKARLFRSPRAAVAIAVATEDRPGTESAETLRDFLNHLSLDPAGG